MPYKGEGASRLGHEAILKDPSIELFLRGCETRIDPGTRVGEVMSRVIDLSAEIQHPTDGVVLAFDGSTYEASADNSFPSVKVGLVKLSQVLVKIADYLALGDEDEFVDPQAVSDLMQHSTARGVPLPGSGVIQGSLRSRSFFRKAVLEAFQHDKFRIGNETLYDTLVDLLARRGQVRDVDGKLHVVFSGGQFTCPATGERLTEDLLIDIEKASVQSPFDSSELIHVTDSLRLGDAFVEEGTNQEVYTRAMNVMEQVVFAHAIRYLHREVPDVLKGLYAVHDGPLAIFGQPARIHRGLMHLLHQIKSDYGWEEDSPVFMGFSKTGKIVEHGNAIKPILDERMPEGTLALPIDDEYRYSLIEPGAKRPDSNFGNDTYFGQDFLIRSRRGRMYSICIAYPFADKTGGDFQQRKVAVTHYGKDIARAASVIDMMETHLFEDATIATHLAHRYASIAHRPAGKTLDAFVKSLLKPSSGANGQAAE